MIKVALAFLAIVAVVHGGIFGDVFKAASGMASIGDQALAEGMKGASSMVGIPRDALNTLTKKKPADDAKNDRQPTYVRTKQRPADDDDDAKDRQPTYVRTKQRPANDDDDDNENNDRQPTYKAEPSSDDETYAMRGRPHYNTYRRSRY